MLLHLCAELHIDFDIYILYFSSDENTLKSLLQEDPHLTTQRAALKETVSMLTSSLALFNAPTLSSVN
jgi:hypothetical protein